MILTRLSLIYTKQSPGTCAECPGSLYNSLPPTAMIRSDSSGHSEGRNSSR